LAKAATSEEKEEKCQEEEEEEEENGLFKTQVCLLVVTENVLKCYCF